MQLQDSELASIRDYVGSSPADGELFASAESFEYWQEVALRVLNRRLADADGGEAVTSFALSGVLSVGQKAANFETLAARISSLEYQLAALRGLPSGPVSISRARRPDRAR